MAVIVFSPKASEDLDSIKEYIENELKSPIAANNRIIEILDAIDQLAIFPELGTSLKGKVISLPHYRYLSVANNIIFYKIEQDKVQIIRILGSKTDYLRNLEIIDLGV